MNIIEHSEKSECLTPIKKMQSPETFNTNIVASFLSFPTDIYMPYSDKHNESCGHRKVADQRQFQQKAENIFSFRVKIGNCSDTELEEQMGLKHSRVHGPFQSRLNLNFGSAVPCLQFP
jgi:hypothetical protein